MIKKEFHITNDIYKTITGDIRYPSRDGKFPVVFILHGFKGFKDWGFFPYTAEKIADAGAVTVCFNFSMNGIAGKSDILDRPEDFAENTISRQRSDLKNVIHSFEDNYLGFKDEISDIVDGKAYLLGHSLGAAIALLEARENENIDKLALWSSVSVFDRYTDRQKQDWKEKGYLEFVNQRTGQTLKMNSSYLEDFQKNKDEFDLIKTASEINIPMLVVHGSEDLTVKIEEARKISAAYSERNNEWLMMKVIRKTGHTFGINHPFDKPTAALDEAIKTTTEFFGLK